MMMVTWWVWPRVWPGSVRCGQSASRSRRGPASRCWGSSGQRSAGRGHQHSEENKLWIQSRVVYQLHSRRSDAVKITRSSIIFKSTKDWEQLTSVCQLDRNPRWKVFNAHWFLESTTSITSSVSWSGQSWYSSHISTTRDLSNKMMKRKLHKMFGCLR